MFVVFKVSLKVKYDVLFIPSVVGLGRSIACISFDLYFCLRFRAEEPSKNGARLRDEVFEVSTVRL